MKSGDKVVILTEHYDSFDEIHKGKEYTLLERVSFGERWRIKEPSWFYLLDKYQGKHWDLVKEYTWNSKFNIGDKVVYAFSEFPIITEIKEVRFYSYGTFYVLSFGRHAKESELELYEEPKVKELSVKEISDLLGYEVKVVK